MGYWKVSSPSPASSEAYWLGFSRIGYPPRGYFLPLLLLGAVLFPVGFAFLLPLGAPGRYGVLLAASAILQIAATVFSVFALSLLQGMAPTAMLGKVMAFHSPPFLSVPNHWARFLYGAPL